MPAYNEQDTLRQVVEEWYPIVAHHNGSGHSKLVIVNDGSKDKTKQIGEELMLEYPDLVFLTKENGGHGDTVLYAYRYAVENGAEYIFQTDSDGQTDPDEFENFWNCRKDYAAVIGDRQADRQDGKSRIFVENTVRLIIKIIFGVSVPDANAPFRLMRSETAAKYIKKLPEHFNLPNIMLTTYFVYFNEPVKFIKISFKPRQGGVNSINMKRIVKIGIRALIDFADLRRHIND